MINRTKHSHIYMVEGFAPITSGDYSRVFNAISKSSVPLSGLSNLKALMDSIKTGIVSSIPFKKIQSALLKDRVNVDDLPHLKFEFLKFKDVGYNLVVNEGLNEILDKFYKGSNYTAAHYVGLTDGTPNFQAADTAAQIGGTNVWAEVVAYDELVRQTLTLGAVAAQSVDNSASKAAFTIAANGTTIGGGFLSTVSTKSGITGALIGGAAFAAGDKSLDDDDTLNVTVTCTASAS